MCSVTGHTAPHGGLCHRPVRTETLIGNGIMERTDMFPKLQHFYRDFDFYIML
jgi:hypothetical protein